MIKSAEGSAGLLHKITKPTMWRGGVQILKEEEDARLLDRCEAKRKDWAKQWQCDESVHNVEDKPWKNEELKKLEEALPKREECDLEKASGLYKAIKEWDATGLSENSLGLDTRNKKGHCRVPGDRGAERQMAATSMHEDVLLDSDECPE